MTKRNARPVFYGVAHGQNFVVAWFTTRKAAEDAKVPGTWVVEGEDWYGTMVVRRPAY